MVFYIYTFFYSYTFYISASSVIMSELRYYEKLSVLGNKKIQQFVEDLISSSGKKDDEEDEVVEEEATQ